MKELSLGPWPLGMDMLSNESLLPRDPNTKQIVAVRDAVNGDFDAEGVFARRGEFVRLNTTPAHSLWRGKLGAYGVVGGALCRLDAGGNAYPLVTLPYDAALSYEEINGKLVYSNLGTIGVVENGVARPLAEPTPAAPGVTATANGGLFAGRYGVLVTTLAHGEESGASEAAFVEVTEGGGISITLPDRDTVTRVYRTPANGDQFYRCDDVPPHVTSYLLGLTTQGGQPGTRFLDPLPPGTMVRKHHGRLVTVRGRNLWFSEPMRYGLTSLRHNFVTMPLKVRFIECVEAGIWVGQPDGVRFLRGADPDDFKIEQTGAKPPVAGCSTLVDAELLSPDVAAGFRSAVWLADNGYVVGTAQGQIVEPQAARITLAATSGAIAVHDRRLISVVR